MIWLRVFFARRKMLTGLAAVLLACGASAAHGEKPNILLIMADDVGSDAIGCYGGQSHPTPHIDALARGGMRFTHGFAMPVCHPSRICLTTGRYPFRFGKAGMRWGDFPKEGEELTIAHRLRQGGYATAVAGKWQLCLMKNDLNHPSRLGFDQWCLFGWHEGARFRHPFLYQNGKQLPTSPSDYGPDIYVRFLQDFMRESHEQGKPFFAYYPMALCHDVTDDLGDRHVPFFTDGRWQTYAEMISSMDDMIGRLMTGLDELGLRDNTLVIFTTDNGTPAASYLSVDPKGKMTRPKVFSIRNGKVVPGGKGKTDDTGTRVPLIANWPGKIEAGGRSEILADLTDLLPTLADVAGLPAKEVKRDGLSYAPTLLGRPQEVERAWVYIEHRGRRCVRGRRYKLYDDGRFYDLAADPLEREALEAAELPSETRRLHDRFSRLLADTLVRPGEAKE